MRTLSQLCASGTRSGLQADSVTACTRWKSRGSRKQLRPYRRRGHGESAHGGHHAIAECARGVGYRERPCVPVGGSTCLHFTPHIQCLLSSSRSLPGRSGDSSADREETRRQPQQREPGAFPTRPRAHLRLTAFRGPRAPLAPAPQGPAVFVSRLFWRVRLKTDREGVSIARVSIKNVKFQAILAR